MSTNDTIQADFEQLRFRTNQLKHLMSKMKRPSYDALTFWTNNAAGSGEVRDELYQFARLTIEFYDNLSLLAANTAAYFEQIQKLREADENSAKQIEG